MTTRDDVAPQPGWPKPKPKPTPLSDAEIETVRAWSERGTPTSAVIVLDLIARVDELRGATPKAEA